MKKIILASLFMMACTGNSPTGQDANATVGGIAEENDLCICTKEYEPVCGSDGKTYGNTCEAGCAKVESKPGAC